MPTDPLTVGILSSIAGALALESLRRLYPSFTIDGTPWKGKQANREVVAISVIQAGKLVLMTKRNPEAQDVHLDWCFPSARIKPNENIIERIKKRYQEKFNIEVKVIKKIGEREIPNKGEKLVYFHCKHDRGTLDNKDPEENSLVEWVDPSEAQKRAGSFIANNVVKLIKKIEAS